jgi:hypothetical protein
VLPFNEVLYMIETSDIRDSMTGDRRLCMRRMRSSETVMQGVVVEASGLKEKHMLNLFDTQISPPGFLAVQSLHSHRPPGAGVSVLRPTFLETAHEKFWLWP